MDTDVMMVIGANPPDAHPVFASQMKRRLREGAKLIVIDPRKTGLVKSPHVKADFHLPLQPGTNVAMINAIAHTVMTEGLMNQDYINERCDTDAFNDWLDFIIQPQKQPRSVLVNILE